MFTGIVQAMGRITQVAQGPSAARLVIDPGTLAVDDVGIGDSIAVGGCCLTVVAVEGSASAPRLAFDASAETLACTAGLDRPGPVNLEKALRLSDRLGGHLMTGHVDGVGTVVSLAPVQGAGWDAGSRRLEIEAPRVLARYIAAKGSVAVQGVSLTVNGVDDVRFHVNLIPHTLDVTTLSALAPGAKVNLEIDLIARYVARMAEFDAAGGATPRP
jgi:riboflavin synthase